MINARSKQVSGSIQAYGAMVYTALVVGLFVAFDVWFMCSVWFRGC